MKSRIKNFNDLLDTLMGSLPFTIIPVILYFLILGGILSYQNLVDSAFFTTFSLFCLILIPNNFLIESLSTDKKTKTISLFISVVLALTIGIMSNFGNEIFLSKLTHISIGYALTLFFISVYLNYQKDESEFGNYILKTLSSYLKITINYVALAFGGLFITLAFNYLLLSDINYYSVLSLQIIIFGCYYLPSLIYRLYKPEKEAEAFFKNLISYILIPLVTIAFVIIYLYIIKLIITFTLPANQVFYIVSFLFLIAMPVWTMSKKMKLNKTETKLTKLFPVLFIPLIFIQIYCLSIRIISYGLTTTRYLCAVFVIIEVIYYLIYFTKPKKCGQIILYIAGISFIAYSIPYINMYDLSNQSQYNRLKKYSEIKNPTDKELKQLTSSYYYLYYNNEGATYLDKLNISKSYIDSISKDYYNHYYYADNLNPSFEVEGYKNGTIVNGYIENGNLTIRQNYDTILTTTSDEFENYLNNRENLDNYLEDNFEVKLDDDTKLIITEISFNYNENSVNADYYNFQGILLTK